MAMPVRAFCPNCGRELSAADVKIRFRDGGAYREFNSGACCGMVFAVKVHAMRPTWLQSRADSRAGAVS